MQVESPFGSYNHPDECIQDCKRTDPERLRLGGERALILSLTFLISLTHLAVAQQNCPRFRGANGDGVFEDAATLPTTWSKTENVLWKTEVTGWGWSCPVIWGERVFLTSVASDDEYETPKKGLYLGQGRWTPPDTIHHWLVHCLDIETGKEIWRKEVYAGKPTFPRHPKSSYAAETPVTDGQALYVLFGDLGLFCLDFNGDLLWEKKIDAKKSFLGYGAASSPVLCDDQVVIVYDNLEDSYVASYQAKTGDPVWRKKRDEDRSTWATPYVWKTDNRVEIVVSGRKAIRAYDTQGDQLWSLEGKMSNLIIPSPFAVNDLLYVTSGYVGDRNRPVFAIRPQAKGDISLEEDTTDNEFVAWFQPKAGPYNTSPIVYKDRYYTLYDQGFMACHNAKTGEEIYGKSRFPSGASFTASPWAYNGNLYCLSEDGDTYVVPADEEFRVIQTNALDELALATPAVAQGKLFVRTASQLYCLKKSE